MTHQFPLPSVPTPGGAQPPSFVSAKVTDGIGRYLLEGERKAFVADSSHRPDSPEAPNPGELLLSALAVCALGSVQRVAGEENIVVGPRTLANAIAYRNEDDAKRNVFKLVHVEVFVDVDDQSLAEKLVGHFTENCPILNTTRRGGPVKVEVITAKERRTVLDNQADWLGASAQGTRP